MAPMADQVHLCGQESKLSATLAERPFGVGGTASTLSA